MAAVDWTPAPRRWARADALALLAWTAAIAWFFREPLFLRKALFYFDITEINYPYRAFWADELRAGRFSRWMPGLYCGLPLFSESQAGYFHPLKYFLYPFLSTWRAFNLDTILSVWLTGLATYGWLRRHVGAAGALTGAGIFGLGGFTWAHLIHTSMVNALISVPLAVWALESAWEGGKLRAVGLGAVAIACQVFAGHLQDTILTGLLLGLYGVYRGITERGMKRRIYAVSASLIIVVVGGLLSAVQWIPSKELIDRSPRAGGLSKTDQAFGSWHPELLPTFILREAYGTRARDTDWMDGFYPYHEMNVYLGVVGLMLAAVGAGAHRDRWVGFWLILVGVASLLMLGKYTFLFDVLHRVPIIGTGRISVRYHLWMSMGVAALAAVGVDRLGRPGVVSTRAAGWLLVGLVGLSAPILAYLYSPIFGGPDRWTKPEHLDRYRWLARELAVGAGRLAGLSMATYLVAGATRRRPGLAAILPLLAILDLLAAHADDLPTVDPSYWTVPPSTVAKLKADPSLIRVYGEARYASGEPGYASEPDRIDFAAGREPLAWSLPPVWGLSSTSGVTPIFPRRRLAYTDKPFPERLDVESMTHALTARRVDGRVSILRNPTALPRARLMGNVVYAADEAAASAALDRLAGRWRTSLVVEGTGPAVGEVRGEARIVEEVPERVVVRADAATPAYLFLADAFDPGWSATVDGYPAPILPADLAFRAVYLEAGPHAIVFRYEPAGFRAGLAVGGVGLAILLLMMAWPRAIAPLGDGHGDAGWPRGWPWWGVGLMAAVVLGSTVRWDGSGLGLQTRWARSVHTFTWGSGLEAMRAQKGAG